VVVSKGSTVVNGISDEPSSVYPPLLVTTIVDVVLVVVFRVASVGFVVVAVVVD
jgi:hypothetical protein